MEDRVEFLAKLNGLVQLAKNHGDKVTVPEVQEYFAGAALNEEQMGLLYEYLMSQKVTIVGYRMSGSVKDGWKSEEPETVPLTAEEQAYVEDYLAQLSHLPQGGEEAKLAYYLPKVVEEAVKLHHPQVFIGDLIQEGSMSLMLAAAEVDASCFMAAEEQIMEAVRGGMRLLIESQTETKRQDERMAAKVAELDETVKSMTEEFGRKVSVDEVAERLGITEAEVNNILKLAGEDVEEEE